LIQTREEERVTPMGLHVKRTIKLLKLTWKK